jgi:hypothetical protein
VNGIDAPHQAVFIERVRIAREKARIPPGDHGGLPVNAQRQQRASAVKSRITVFVVPEQRPLAVSPTEVTAALIVVTFEITAKSQQQEVVKIYSGSFGQTFQFAKLDRKRLAASFDDGVKLLAA